jgi:hypothetical protein
VKIREKTVAVEAEVRIGEEENAEEHRESVC